MTDYKPLAQTFISHLHREQLDEILEAISTEYRYGACPLCGCEKVPYDAHGNDLDWESPERASGYREVHDEECLVTLIEQSFSASPPKGTRA